MSNCPESRAFGSIFGAFIGDAIGGVLKFQSLEYIKNNVEGAMKYPGRGKFYKLGKGQVTDDSEMAMCILHALTP